jgi:hypothetical protein
MGSGARLRGTVIKAACIPNRSGSRHGSLDLTLPTAHASISHTWARHKLVFWAAAMSLTALEMAHQAFVVINFHRRVTADHYTL